MVVSYRLLSNSATMRSNNKKHTSLKLKFTKGEKSTGNGKKNSNITGYQKRIAQKPPKASNLLDVYEFDDKQRKGRTRADVTLDLSREEAREYGVEEQSDEDDLERMRQKLKIGEDGVVNSEDDEDIDSDDAFDQSDEERFREHNFQVGD
jgi:U3 small nucleolar RNA-associated protein 14